MSFSAIPDRGNGQRILYGWFNALKNAGAALEGFLGGGFVGETSFSIANNTGPSDVTGLVLAQATYKSAILFVEVRRKTDSTEAISVGMLKLYYRAATSDWALVDELSGDEDGVTFTITAAGQLQYTTDNMAGSGYTGTMKYRMITTGA
jgi:hypothetical protein